MSLLPIFTTVYNGTDFHDDVSVYSNNGPITMYGNGGVDFLQGGGSADTIYGGTGDDRLNGAGGNDTIYGDEGADQIRGGSGSDLMFGGSDQYVEPGDDVDTFIFESSDMGNGPWVYDMIGSFGSNDVIQFGSSSLQDVTVNASSSNMTISDPNSDNQIDVWFSEITWQANGKEQKIYVNSEDPLTMDNFDFGSNVTLDFI